MKQIITLLILSLVLLNSCRKDITNSPLVVEEAKVKTPPVSWAYNKPFDDVFFDVCTRENVHLFGTVYYNSSYTQTTTLYTSDYKECYDSLSAIGASGRKYTISGTSTTHLEADVEGDALTIRVRDISRTYILKTIGGRNDLTSIYTSHWQQPTCQSDVCK